MLKIPPHLKILYEYTGIINLFILDCNEKGSTVRLGGIYRFFSRLSFGQVIHGVCCPSVQSSGKLDLTKASANGGGTALPQSATCLSFAYSTPRQSRSMMYHCGKPWVRYSSCGCNIDGCYRQYYRLLPAYPLNSNGQRL